MSEHQTDQYRDLRVEQLGVELRLARSQVRALKTKLVLVTETWGMTMDEPVAKLRDELAAARLQIAGLIVANKSLAESNAEWAETVKQLRDKEQG